MSFTRVNPGGWGLFEVLTSSQMNQLDINASRAIDGFAGGTYNNSSPIVLQGDLEVQGTFTISGTTEYTGDTTFKRNVTFDAEGNPYFVKFINGMSVEFGDGVTACEVFLKTGATFDVMANARIDVKGTGSIDVEDDGHIDIEDGGYIDFEADSGAGGARITGYPFFDGANVMIEDGALALTGTTAFTTSVTATIDIDCSCNFTTNATVIVSSTAGWSFQNSPSFVEGFTLARNTDSSGITKGIITKRVTTAGATYQLIWRARENDVSTEMPYRVFVERENAYWARVNNAEYDATGSPDWSQMNSGLMSALLSGPGVGATYALMSMYGVAAGASDWDAWAAATSGLVQLGFSTHTGLTDPTPLLRLRPEHDQPSALEPLPHTLYAKNIVKAFAFYLTDGLGGITLYDSFNCSAAIVSGQVRLTFYTGFDTAELTVATGPTIHCIPWCNSKYTDRIEMNHQSWGGSPLDAGSDVVSANVIVMGRQIEGV